MRSLLSCVRAAVVALAVLCAPPALAQEKTGNKPGFVLKPGTARIVLMRPSIKVGAQSTGGMFEPNAEWTVDARTHVGNALKTAQTGLGNQVVAQAEGAGDAALAGQYQNLFATLAKSVIEYQFFPGNRLNTKVRKGQFDWGVGPGVGQLPGVEGADYALFITTEDHYGSAGRKALQLFAAMGGVRVKSGLHIGYAGLVDLKTGELVWLNADYQMGGDVRNAEGAAKRVSQLLEGFPGRTVSVAAAK